MLNICYQTYILLAGNVLFMPNGAIYLLQYKTKLSFSSVATQEAAGDHNMFSTSTWCLTRYWKETSDQYIYTEKCHNTFIQRVDKNSYTLQISQLSFTQKFVYNIGHVLYENKIQKKNKQELPLFSFLQLKSHTKNLQELVD
jgi:hypothetical protein